MRNFRTPFLQPLGRIASVQTTDAPILGRIGPFRRGELPMAWNTPFGKTASDLKGPTIPKPVLFPIGGLKFLKGGMFHPASAMGTLPGVKLLISGVTKDSTGAILASCTVTLFRTTTNLSLETVVSDANGVYVFSAIGVSETYYVVAYKVGSPDVAGTTVNTLVGVA